MDEIERLKVAEKAYQISKDWYDREKITEDEYNEQIGDGWKNLEPYEIINLMCDYIRSL